MTDWQNRAVEKEVDRRSRLIFCLIFIYCYCCCDLYKSINLKDTKGQSANEDTKLILATYPKSAGGSILCAEAPVTIHHPGLSYLSRSSNMVQAFRIPAWGFSEFLWSQPSSSHLISHSHPDIGLAQHHHSPPSFLQIKHHCLCSFRARFFSNCWKDKLRRSLSKKILNRLLCDYLATNGVAYPCPVGSV